jgi:E3 ubiquitin-protein ligase SHPRH
MTSLVLIRSNLKEVESQRRHEPLRRPLYLATFATSNHMRTTTTRHLDPIRCSDWREKYLLRSPLNIPLLVNLLREHLGSGEIDKSGNNTSVIIGKKRSLPSGSTYVVPKKRKTVDDIKDIEASGEYSLEPELIPAFRHIYELGYRKPVVTDAEIEEPVDGRLTQEEVELETILNQYRSSLESISFDLGEVSTCIKGSNILLYRNQVSLEDTLLVLPRVVDEGFDLQADDYRPNAGSLHDLIYCCHDLCGVGKIDVSTKLKIDSLPFNTDNSQNELPFRILLELTISLVCPNIFQEVPRHLKVNAGLEQRQRRVLNYMFPSVLQPPATYRGETDIPFLYTILRPAPDLPSEKASKAVQPVTLVPILLPFQRRSVAWMLKREGKTIDEQGRLISWPQHELPLFWEEVELDGRKFYLHRLKGLLFEIRPESEIQPGGSLNEAPGLGKTVECIALILLNPGIGRNPSVKHWDEEAKVFVKQIKVLCHIRFSFHMSELASVDDINRLPARIGSSGISHSLSIV